MSLTVSWILLAVVVLLIGYLLVSLLDPEKF